MTIECSHRILSYLGIDVEPFLILYFASHSLYLFTIPQLLQSIICHDHYNATVCNALNTFSYQSYENAVQEKASKWMTILPMSGLALSAIAVLFLGPLSDIIGKRRTMIAFPFLTLIQGIIFLVLSLSPVGVHPAWLTVGIFIPGILGDSQGSTVVAIGYRANTTSMEHRTTGVARAGGMLLISSSCSVLLGGILIRYGGFGATYSLFIIFSVINIFYVVFVLPDEAKNCEQVQDKASQIMMHKARNLETSSAEEEKISANFRSKVIAVFSELCHLRHYKRLKMNKSERKTIIFFVALLSVSFVIFAAQEYNGVLYLSHAPFRLQGISLGLFVAGTFFSQGLGPIFLVPYLQRVHGFGDFQLLITGYISSSIYYTILGLAVKVWMIYLAVISAVGMAIPSSVCRSLLTKHVADDLHGTILGITEAVYAISSVIASFLVNTIYYKTLTIYHGAVCFVGVFLSLICLILTLVYNCNNKRNSDKNLANMEEKGLLSEE